MLCTYLLCYCTEMCIISIHVHDVVYTLIVSIHCVYDVLYFVLLFAYYSYVPLVVDTVHTGDIRGGGRELVVSLKLMDLH